jgi:hypothetical protein
MVRPRRCASLGDGVNVGTGSDDGDDDSSGDDDDNDGDDGGDGEVMGRAHDTVHTEHLAQDIKLARDPERRLEY